jgi:hypothetical protein
MQLTRIPFARMRALNGWITPELHGLPKRELAAVTGGEAGKANARLLGGQVDC